mmetsp:Transcript_43782/g.72927  ORF Transcript_43782/g.72927 Transcript_43782/m.72927 type:complete len:234 (+) Transcript_43782:1889-2590(+)
MFRTKVWSLTAASYRVMDLGAESLSSLEVGRTTYWYVASAAARSEDTCTVTRVPAGYPPGGATHTLLLVVVLPSGHKVHLEAPAKLKAAPLHGRHCANVVEAGMLEKVPAGQSWQTSESRVVEYRPDGHATHVKAPTTSPSTRWWPGLHWQVSRFTSAALAVHAVHVDVPATLKWSAGQAWQLLISFAPTVRDWVPAGHLVHCNWYWSCELYDPFGHCLHQLATSATPPEVST